VISKYFLMTVTPTSWSVICRCYSYRSGL